jgi:hypothetical protein
MEDKNVYGIWIPGEGWLKGKDIFADESLEKANQVARLIGKDARVYFIDQSIIDLERQYLEQERRTIWHIFKNLFKNKIDKSSKLG